MGRGMSRQTIDLLTLQDAVAANGNGTSLRVAEHATALLEVSGTFSATVNFEVTVDPLATADASATWYAIDAVKRDGGTRATTTTAAGQYVVDVSGNTRVRARVSGYASGNVTVRALAMPYEASGGAADAQVGEITPGTAAANLGKAEDAAHASGDTGVFILAVRDDTPAATGADGDYVAVLSDANGSVYQAPAASATVVGTGTLFDADANNTAQVLKASAGRLYALEVSNPNTTDVFVQLFDVAAGGVTVGTTTPKLSLLVPGGTGASNRGGMDKVFTVPVAFDTAITYAVTTTPTGSADPTSDVTLNAFFK